MVQAPEPDCWLHPDLEVRDSPIEGRGLFARAAIGAGTVVSCYGTSSGAGDFQMTCEYRSSLCRGMITGSDWRRSELHERYQGHWIPVLADRIRSATATTT